MIRVAAEQPRRVTLDGMRGVAALLVAIYHYQSFIAATSIPGYLAVDFFFGLSGFVLADRFDGRLAGGLGVAGFLRARWCRLYPLYFIALLLSLAVHLLLVALGDPRAPDVRSTMRALTFGLAVLPDPFAEYPFPLNGNSWSLLAEAVVSAAYATILWRLRDRWVFAVALLALLIVAASVGPSDHLNVGWQWPAYGAGFARAFFSFAMGILVRRWTASAPRIRAGWAIWPVVALSAVLIWLPCSVAAQLLCIAVAFPVLLAWGAGIEPPRWLAACYTQLGHVSYAVYLVHRPVVELLRPALRVMPAVVGCGLFLATTLAIAYPLARWFDPAARAGMDRLRRPRWPERCARRVTAA